MSEPILRAAEQIGAAFRVAGLAEMPNFSLERFAKYLLLLEQWNAQINLTAIRDREAILTRHFTESAFTAQQLPDDISTLLDIGSGAGFPGIPIAICRPEIAVTLAESHGKKCVFLREALRTLSLKAEVYQGRAEELIGKGAFDAVAMRAVDGMPEMMTAAASLSKKWLVLLTTVRDAAHYRTLAPQREWKSPIALPGARNSVLLLGGSLGGGSLHAGR